MLPITGRRHHVSVPPFETVVDCRDLDAELRFFLDELGFRIHLVTPADAPTEYVVEQPATGGRIRLRRSAADVPASLRLPGDRPDRLVAPGGTVIVVDPPPGEVGADMTVPDAVPSLTVTGGDDGDFGVGRAGMTYRDLLPDRWGGRFIASHIRVDHEGTDGDIADWVHFHRIRFQMIYVAAGWVDVVYEDQGPPFRMHEGDCVLQPPEIRHQVLRSSTGLEVIEIGCPADHDTIADPGLALPNSRVDADRDFAGQRFVRHVAADAEWTRWLDESTGFVQRDTGIGEATGGLAGAIVVRSTSPSTCEVALDGEFALVVGLQGSAQLTVGEQPATLVPRGSISIPPGLDCTWTNTTDHHEALVVTLPANGLKVR